MAAFSFWASGSRALLYHISLSISSWISNTHLRRKKVRRVYAFTLGRKTKQKTQVECTFIWWPPVIMGHSPKAGGNFLSTCNNMGWLTGGRSLTCKWVKQGSVSLTFPSRENEAKGLQRKHGPLDNCAAEGVFHSNLFHRARRRWMSRLYQVLYCVDANSDSVFKTPLSLPGRFCLITVLKRVGCVACTRPFMFCSVITHLYCLCDLVFLPGINHCQQGRGFKNIQGQKGGSSSLTFAPLPVRVEKWRWFAETIRNCFGHTSVNVSALFRLIVHPFSCFYLPCRKMQLYTKLSKSLTASVGIQIFKVLNRKPIYKSALHRDFARHKQRLTPPVGVASRSRLACQTWFSHSLFSLLHARRFTGWHTLKHKPHRQVQRLPR